MNIYGSVDLDPWLSTEPTFLWRIPAPRLGTWASVNYPNPFNPVTRIDFSVEQDGARTRIRIYDVAGGLVRTLMDQAMHAGRHTAIWDGRNGERQSVASGLYFARIQIGTGFEKMQKMMLVR